jgi:hypothetical protein
VTGWVTHHGAYMFTVTVCVDLLNHNIKLQPQLRSGSIKVDSVEWGEWGKRVSSGSQHPAVLELELLPHRTDLVVECDSDATELGSRIQFIHNAWSSLGHKRTHSMSCMSVHKKELECSIHLIGGMPQRLQND